jgi:hypothetical protein
LKTAEVYLEGKLVRIISMRVPMLKEKAVTDRFVDNLY